MPTFPLIVDKSVEYPNRFAVTDVSEGVVDLTPEPGAGELGTELNTGLFNGVKQYVDESSNIVCVATRVSSASYTVTDSRAPSPIPVGYTCTIVPDKPSMNVTTTLSINGEGTAPLRVGYSNTTAPNTEGLALSTAITANVPMSVTYLGTAWRINDLSRLDLTATDVVGPLPMSKGGTGVSSVAKGDVLYAPSTSGISKLPIGTTGQILSVSADKVPAWVDNPAKDWITGHYTQGNWEWIVYASGMCDAYFKVPLASVDVVSTVAPLSWTAGISFGIPPGIFLASTTPLVVSLTTSRHIARLHWCDMTTGSHDTFVLRIICTGGEGTISGIVVTGHFRGTYGGRTA